MTIELRMPALSPTMEKGTLARWLIAEGDVIKPGDQIAEIETDKATMEFEAPEEGYIASIVVPAGTEDVAVGTVIAILSQGVQAPPGPVLDEPALAKAGPVGAASAEPSTAIPDLVPQPAPEVAAPRRRLPPAHRVKISPLALRVAQAKGINLDGIVGTGPNGRIVRADLGISPAVAPQPILSVPSMPAGPGAVIAPPPADVPVQTVKLSSMRKTIARRLSESKQTVPHFYLTVRCNLDRLLGLRAELNATLEERGIKISVNDMLIKAMALALIDVPDANVQFGGEELYHFGRADISMAVAIDGGLVTPVIKQVDTLSLSAIAETTRALAEKARAGKLTPEEYQGGTASISNLGMFGIDEMFPVINPPQALILGVASGVKQPWNVDGRIELATVLSATASFDHRAIDGALAAQFMASFRNRIESPISILS
jgi:pyruvate dehydrogenase E2 component (dihydrolipoamide acetyltransferase)